MNAIIVAVVEPIVNRHRAEYRNEDQNHDRHR